MTFSHILAKKQAYAEFGLAALSRDPSSERYPMWKKTCVVLALNWLPAVASSQEAEAAFCNSMGAMTRNIAAAHQKGVPLREAITWLDQTDNDIAKGFAEMVIMDVYENNSHYTTPAIQERIITQTEDKFFLFCLKLFKD